MKAVKCCVITSLVLLLAVGFVWGQPRGDRPDRAGRMGQQGGMRGGMMMGAAQRFQRVLDRLELTDKQKQTIEAFRIEYTEKIQPLTEKMRERGKVMRDRRQNDPDDAEGLKQMREEMAAQMQEMVKATEEFTEKVKGELTEEQKTKFDEAVAQRRGGQRIDQALRQLLPFNPRDLRDLGLTDEQREKLRTLMEEYREAFGKLRTEYEGKFKELLTDEQKNKIEELETNRPQRDREAMRERFQDRRQPRQGGRRNRQDAN